MSKSLIIISLLILLFTTIGCDKDDFELGSPVVEANQDSLLCRMWLHNVQGDTTNVFHEGEDIRIGLFLQSFKKEDIWVFDDLIPSDINILFYQSNGNYIGGPYPYMYEQKGGYSLVTYQRPLKILFNLDKLDNGKRLSKGDYYLTLQYKMAIHRIDTLVPNSIEIIKKIHFPVMRFNFKIQ